jgi:hypothetical protein
MNSDERRPGETPFAPASIVLRDLATSKAEHVTIGSLSSAMGSRVHGLALILLALPDALPLPIPSTSTILGIPLVAIAGHLAIYGEESRLPARAEAIAVSPAVVRAVARYAVPILQALEKLSRPRLPLLVGNDRALGLLCLYLSILLLLPIPFFNAAPALCLIALALGMVHRDGAMVAAGLVGTLLITISLAFFAEWARSLLAQDPATEMTPTGSGPARN